MGFPEGQLMRVFRESVSLTVDPESVQMGPRPPDLLRMIYSECVEAFRAALFLFIFSLARKHLLDSLLYFLCTQGHHHLGHRRSLHLSTEGHSEELHHAAVLGAF